MRRRLGIMQKLRYIDTQVVVQEVPDEIALAISISGCPLACKGCHSSHTWNPDSGQELTQEVLYGLIQKHPHITCVLLYDGLHNEGQLIELLKVVKSFNLKTALYTGLSAVSEELSKYVDYLKVNPYIEELGGLSSPTTNQKMYYRGTDITYKFNGRFTK